MNDLTTMYQHHRAEYSLSVFLTFPYSRSLEKCQSLSFCCSSATVSRRMVFETARSFVINFDTEILCLRAQSLQSCPTLRGTVDHSLPNSSVHGILQARILEWVAMSSSRESSPLRDQTHISDVSCISRWVLYHFTTWEAHIQVAGRIHFLLCRTKAPLPCWLSAQLSDSSR